jgi:anti-sigma-K factor RskA
VLPAQGAPVSLGVLPSTRGIARRALSAIQQRALSSSMQLAVSLEPAGGSPTAQPTGPIVFTAVLSAAS